jgi:hypothetical protein
MVDSRSEGNFRLRNYCRLFFFSLLLIACGLETNLAPTRVSPASAPEMLSANSTAIVPTPTLVPSITTITAPTPEVQLARLSTLLPLSFQLRRQFDLSSDVTGLALVDITGGGLPDLVVSTSDRRLHAFSLNRQSFNQLFENQASVIQAGDMDEDRLGDVFLGDDNGVLIAMEGDFNMGAFVRRGAHQSPGPITALAPIKSRGVHSLIVATDNGHLLSLDLRLQPQWTAVVNEGSRITRVGIRQGQADVVSLVAGTSSGHLAMFSDRGVRLWERAVSSGVTAIDFMDVTGNGEADVIIGNEQGDVIAFNHEGTELWRWSASGTVTVLLAVTLEQSGSPVLLVGSNLEAGNVSALDRNGRTIWQTTVGFPLRALDAAYLDGDNRLDIVAGTSNGTLVLLDSEGAVRGQHALPASVSHLRLVHLDDSDQRRLVATAGRAIYTMDLIPATSEVALPLTPVPGAATPTLAHSSVTPAPTRMVATPASLPNTGTRPHYLLDVNLDYLSHTAQVDQTVTIYNYSPDAWSEVVFNVSAAYWRGLFNLNQLTLTMAGQTEMVTPRVESTMFHLPLPRPLQPGESVQVQFKYILVLPRLDPVGWGPVGNAGWGPDVIQMGDWYPALIPYDAGTSSWQTWEYRPVGDPVRSTLADFDVRITTVANVTVAAPGFVSQEENTRHYRLENGRAFAFLASLSYILFEGQSQVAPVKLYVLTKHRQIGPTVLDTIIQAINLFHRQFGPYPYRELIMAENGFLTAMEYSGIVSLSSFAFDTYDGTPRSLLPALTAHEVAHQWWYGAVGNDQVLQPWLDESLSMFGELLYYETYYPEHVAWWWQFRVERWRPTGYVDVTIYDYQDSPTFVHNMYGRAAYFIEALRSEMGERNFNAFLRDYYTLYRFQTATTRDFLSLAQSYAGTDLNPLFRTYFRELPSNME